ncbi:MAG: glycosyltransferase [Candidatus Sumerlaeota bacterium]|nr:glycosyltransferase [Candidatus Sumerlaeota bacterium]
MTVGPGTIAPDVSVVIAFYNRRGGAARCLEAVLSQELPLGIAMEVIAVDNGSTDSTREELARFPVRLADCAERGPAAARNAGIRAARAPIIATTDSDCAPEPGWLARIIEPFADARVIAAGGPIVSLEHNRGVTLFIDFFRILNQEKFFRGGQCNPPFVATANAAFRREAVERVGGFDESLLVGEDADLCWRMLGAGGAIAYCPLAVVRHAHRDTFMAFFRMALNYGEGCAALFARHRGRFGQRRLVQWDNIYNLALAPWRALRGLVTGRTPFERKIALYDALWRSGFTIGCVAGSIRNRIVFLLVSH